MDLLDLQSAEPIIRAVIAEEGRVVFEAEDGLFERLSLYYIKQRMDLAPFIAVRMKEIGNRVREEVRHARERGNLRKD